MWSSYFEEGKVVRHQGIELPNGETMKELEQEVYTYLGIVELDKIKESEMKKKTIKEYKRRLRLILNSKLNGKNKIAAINTWAVAIFRYGAGVIDLKESELKSVDRKTRKTLTMYGAMHPKGDVDRLYIKRNEGGRGMSSVEYVVRGEENRLGHYVLHSEEKLLRGELKLIVLLTPKILKSRKLRNVRRNFWKRCMDSLVEKCQKKLTKKNLGIGYPDEMLKLKQRLYYALPRNRHSEPTISSIILTKVLIAPCAECVESVENVCNIYLVGVKNVPRKNTREDTIMLLKRFIGICVRDMT